MNPSLVDYLNGQGKDSSLTGRANLATSYGLVSNPNEYLTLAGKGLNADINTKLLTSLQNGETPKAPTTPATSPISTSPNPTNTAISTGLSNMNNTPVTGSQIERGASLPEPTSYLSVNQPSKGSNPSYGDVITGVAKSTLNSTGQAIDQLKAIREQNIATEKAQVQGEISGYKTEIAKSIGSTKAQDALANTRSQFQVDQNIATLNDIRTKIVNAQEALQMGLIYEGDRPARMSFITGAQSTLQKQGLAIIGALQGSAAVIQGNLDLAKSYADATISAIQKDNEESFNALTTLLNLADKRLITLESDEKSVIDSRIKSLEDEATRLQKNKDDVLDFMTKYPHAFVAGGVTLTDTKEQALAKMAPYLAADEKTKFDAEIASKNAATAKTNQELQVKKDKETLLAAKAKGMTYDEAVLAFGNTIPIADIAAIYGRKTTDQTGQQSVVDAYYAKYQNPDGTMKPGISVSIDPKNGRPVLEDPNGYYDSSGNLKDKYEIVNGKVQKKASAGNWFTNLFK